MRKTGAILEAAACWRAEAAQASMAGPHEPTRDSAAPELNQSENKLKSAPSTCTLKAARPPERRPGPHPPRPLVPAGHTNAQGAPSPGGTYLCSVSRRGAGSSARLRGPLSPQHGRPGAPRPHRAGSPPHGAALHPGQRQGGGRAEEAAARRSSPHPPLPQPDASEEGQEPFWELSRPLPPGGLGTRETMLKQQFASGAQGQTAGAPRARPAQEVQTFPPEPCCRLPFGPQEVVCAPGQES